MEIQRMSTYGEIISKHWKVPKQENTTYFFDYWEYLKNNPVEYKEPSRFELIVRDIKYWCGKVTGRIAGVVNVLIHGDQYY